MKISFGARRSAAPLSIALGLLGAALAPAQAQTEAPPDELVVTGVPHERAPGELAQSVTVVAGDELDRNRAATLGETLANQVGVSSSYFGAGASRPIIRGLAGARVQMLEDGIDTMDAATRQRRSRRHRRTAGRRPDRDLPRPDDAALRQRRRRRSDQYGHDACSRQRAGRRFRGRIRGARRHRRGGAQCGRAPRRRRNPLRVALRCGPTRQRRLRDSGLCARGRRRGQCRSRRRIRRLGEQCGRERIRCVRRVLARR